VRVAIHVALRIPYRAAPHVSGVVWSALSFTSWNPGGGSRPWVYLLGELLAYAMSRPNFFRAGLLPGGARDLSRLRWEAALLPPPPILVHPPPPAPPHGPRRGSQSCAVPGVLRARGRVRCWEGAAVGRRGRWGFLSSSHTIIPYVDIDFALHRVPRGRPPRMNTVRESAHDRADLSRCKQG